ncbi:hypothetical protein Tco_0748971 [Tanacetum coccineum]|uniref:Uncharacterized protein n=1 Tax=Tanacetum coccineum TaxID=301880 RepID=A0ABQ4YY25_9ASTR
MYVKTTTLRCGLTWKPTGRILTYVSLRWIPTRKTVETCINTNDNALPLGKEKCIPNTVICTNSSSLSACTSMASEPISTKVCNNDSPIFVRYPYLYGNPDIGTAVGYRKVLLASPDVSVLDKLHYQLENLSRRFIHESNPNDASRDDARFKDLRTQHQKTKAQDQRPHSMKEQSLPLQSLRQRHKIRKGKAHIVKSSPKIEKVTVKIWITLPLGENARMSNEDDPTIGRGDIDGHSIRGDC